MLSNWDWLRPLRSPTRAKIGLDFAPRSGMGGVTGEIDETVIDHRPFGVGDGKVVGTERVPQGADQFEAIGGGEVRRLLQSSWIDQG